jgi:hypothetical protein
MTRLQVTSQRRWLWRVSSSVVRCVRRLASTLHVLCDLCFASGMLRVDRTLKSARPFDFSTTLGSATLNSGFSLFKRTSLRLCCWIDKNSVTTWMHRNYFRAVETYGKMQ